MRLGVVTALAAVTAVLAPQAHSAEPDIAGRWRGTLTNLPAKDGAGSVEVILDIGPLAPEPQACAVYRHTYVKEGKEVGRKDYKLCRGPAPGVLFVDEGVVPEGVDIKLGARWVGDVLVSPFKYKDALLVTTLRRRGATLEEEIMVIGDRPATDGVVSLEPSSIQRIIFRRSAR